MKTKKIIVLISLFAVLLLVSCTKGGGVDLVVDPPVVVKKFSIEVNVGPNTTTASTLISVVNGNDATVVANADKDYVIESVIVDGFPVPIANNLTTYSHTFPNVITDHKISITSRKVLKFAVTADVSPNITVTYSGPTTDLVSGASLTANFKLPQFYDVDTVLVDKVKASLTNLSYSFSNITVSHTIKVTSKITALGTAFNLLSMPQAFVEDSVHVRTLGTTHWGYNKSNLRDSIFFYSDYKTETLRDGKPSPDYRFEIFRDGKMIGNDTYFLTDNPLTIHFKGGGSWRVLILNEKLLKVIFSSINTTDGEDGQYVFTRH